MTTILVIDARTRDLNAFFASATQDAKGDLVLRYASEAKLPEIPVGSTKVLPFPILIMGSFHAQTSAGFTASVGQGGIPAKVVGGLGKPFGRGGLKRLRKPIAGRLLFKGTTMFPKDENSSSNTASAQAAWEGLKFMVDFEPKSLWLVEGQSDYTRSWKFMNPEQVEYPAIPDEHQLSVFEPSMAPVKDAIRSIMPQSEDEQNRDERFYAAVVAMKLLAQQNKLPESFAEVRKEFGDEVVRARLDDFTIMADDKGEFLARAEGGTLKGVYVDYRDQEHVLFECKLEENETRSDLVA